MKAGMAKRAALNKQRAARMTDVMNTRMAAKKKMQSAWQAQQHLLKALRAQVAAYKKSANAASHDGHDRQFRGELAEGLTAASVADHKSQWTSREEAEAAVAEAEKQAEAFKKRADKAGEEADAVGQKAAQADEEADQAEKAADTKLEAALQKSQEAVVFALSPRLSELSPKSDGKPLSADSKFQCETQTTVKVAGELRKDKDTCTSCKPQKAFQFVYHKARAGKCISYGPIAHTRCTKLNENAYTADLVSRVKDKDVICTKVVAVRQVLSTWDLPNEDRKFFASVSDGKLKHHAFVHCNVWKQTACKGEDCEVKKKVHCDRVCRAQSWNGTEDRCSKNLCNLPGGSLCQQTALTT